VDPVPDPLLLRKSGSAGDRTRDLCICSQKLCPLDHRGGLLVVKKGKLEETANTKFLGSQTDNHINWKIRLSAACRAISVTITPSYQFTVFTFTVIKYGLIFCGNSSNSRKIFTLKKKVVRIMAVAQPGKSRDN
jgi:hypothetical protein